MTAAYPRPSRARGLARLALAVTLLGLPTAGIAHAEPCAGRAVGRWERLGAPPAAPAAQVVPLRAPCAVLAVDTGGRVLRSATGRAYATIAAPPVARVYADPPSGAVVATLRSGGIVVSRDDGRSFAAPAPGPAGNAVAAAVSRTGTLLVATVAEVLTTFWRSTDGGATFTVAGALAATPATLAFDAGAPDAVWLSSTTGAGTGVWRSPDAGTTWQPVLSDLPAYDVDTAPRPGGGLVAVARADGLWRSTTGGATWTRTASPPLAAVRVDSGGPAVLAVADGRPVLVQDPPRRTTALAAGLPPGCRASDLTSDRAPASTFVLRCGDGWYALVSAADPDAAGSGATPPGPPAVGGVRRLTKLARLGLPTDDGTHSGSLAFDGRALYYAGEFRSVGATAPVDTVHLMSPRDGRGLGTLAVGHPVKFLTYDSPHDRFYVDDGRSMWRVGSRGGAAVPAFPSTLSYTWSFDASTRTFVGTYEGDDERSMLTLTESGVVAGRCSLNDAIPAPSSPYAAPSAVVAAADGAYVVLEDDTTVLRVRRDCTWQATYVTETFSESPLENDELVCDPLTFAPRTALWVRDGVVAQVVAYDLPEGYCPFAATLAVTVPRSVADGGSALVCATLRRTGRGEPIPGQAVVLDADGVVLAAPPTDARGRTCATPRLAAAKPTAATPPAARTVPVRARYAGTPQWTPATATAATTVLPLLPRVAVAPPTLPDPGPAPDSHPGRAGPPAPPNPPADPAHVPHPQSQPQAQQNPGQQPGSQAGFAVEDEQAPALVVADSRQEETLAMSARATSPGPGLLLLGAALVTAAAGWALRSQTSSVPVLLRTGPRRSRYPRRRGHAVRRGR